MRLRNGKVLNKTNVAKYLNLPEFLVNLAETYSTEINFSKYVWIFRDVDREYKNTIEDKEEIVKKILYMLKYVENCYEDNLRILIVTIILKFCKTQVCTSFMTFHKKLEDVVKAKIEEFKNMETSITLEKDIIDREVVFIIKEKDIEFNINKSLFIREMNNF